MASVISEKELRVGNYLDFEGDIVTVEETGGMGTKVRFKDGESIWIDLFQMGTVIPTMGMLEGLGFTITKSKVGVGVTYIKDGLKVEFSHSGNLFYKKIIIRSIHQLQNLFFALKERELKF